MDQPDVEHARGIVRRLAAHAAGFQDVLDETDRGPWGRTVSADITALRAALDELAAPALPEPAAGAQQPEPEERRDRYATAISQWHRDPEQRLYGQAADAVIAVADAERQGLLKAVADLAVDIGHARQELSRVVLGQAQASTDMSLEQIVAASVAEYCSEVAATARLRAELGQARGTTGQDTTTPADGELPPPEGPEYAPCVCGHIEPEHRLQRPGWTREACRECDCVDYRTEPADGEQETRQHLTAALVALLTRKGYDPADPEVDHGQFDSETAEVVDAVLPVVRAAMAAGVRRALEDAAAKVLADTTHIRYGSAADYAQRHAKLITSAVAPPAGEQDEEQSGVDLTTTLIIGRSESRCGHCGKSVLPRDTHHVDVSGWTPEPGEGCGARFVAMRSDSWGVTADVLQGIRPDLPVETTPAPPIA